MSWQDYVDTSLLGSGKISDAAIAGHDGNLWACSNTFAPKPEELAALLNAYATPTMLHEHGLTLADTRYIYLRGDDRSIYCRKGPIGVCCVKTSQCIIIALYDTGRTVAGEAIKTVEELADYLIGVGY